MCVCGEKCGVTSLQFFGSFHKRACRPRSWARLPRAPENSVRLRCAPSSLSAAVRARPQWGHPRLCLFPSVRHWRRAHWIRPWIPLLTFEWIGHSPNVQVWQAQPHTPTYMHNIREQILDKREGTFFQSISRPVGYLFSSQLLVH